MMAEYAIDILVRAKQHELELIKQFNQLAYDCYANNDLDGHAYWTDRAFDVIDMYQALNNDLRRVRKEEES